MRSSKWLAIAPAFTIAACELVDPTSRLESGDATADVTLDVATDVATDSPNSNDASADAPKDVAPPSCEPPDGENPCLNVLSKDNGCYCSSSSQAGFNSSAAIPKCLYFCSNGSVIASRDLYCASGCVVAAQGDADYCAVTLEHCPDF